LNIQWYPGHMTKAKRQLADKIKFADLFVVVLDARAPLSTINPDLEKMFQDKKKLYILNKADLADQKATKDWIDYFVKRNIPAVSYSAMVGNPQKLIKQITGAASDIYQRYAAKGMKKTVRAMIAGVPNVGKSAILNRLLGSNKLKEENRPGVTRGLQTVKITPYLELMDSPGLLWPKMEDERVALTIAIIGSIRTEILNEEELALKLLELLHKTRPELLKSRYKIDILPEDSVNILYEICRKRGFLLKGSEYDVERGVRTVLEEFRNGKIGKITLEFPEY